MPPVCQLTLATQTSDMSLKLILWMFSLRSQTPQLFPPQFPSIALGSLKHLSLRSVLLGSIGSTSLTALTFHLYLVAAVQCRAMLLFAFGVAILKYLEIIKNIYDSHMIRPTRKHLKYVRTLQEQVTHLISPQGLTCGCQCSPFS